jgi:predicted phosphodiesterase
MRLLVLSDLHREAWGADDPFPAIDLDASRPDLVVLAGDIDVGARAVAWAEQVFAGVPVLYLPGNHECDGIGYNQMLRDIAAACAATDNVQLLHRSEKAIGGIRILGATLWTDFQLNGPVATEALHPSDQLWQGVHNQDRDWLEARLAEPFAGRTVVITHMAPSARSLPAELQETRIATALASHLDHLVERTDIWIHGHIHDSADYRIGRCRVVCNPCGYPGRDQRPQNPAFDPNLVLEI